MSGVIFFCNIVINVFFTLVNACFSKYSFIIKAEVYFFFIYIWAENSEYCTKDYGNGKLTKTKFSEGGSRMSKILLLNGSAHVHGCTATALEEMIGIFEAEGFETELIQVGNKAIRGCIGCGSCSSTGKCVFNDDLVNEVAPKFESADGLVVGSPVYYGSPNGTIISFMDRLFYSTSFDKHMKVGAAVVSCRRGGNTASFDVLNKYFTISGMPVASSTYWNMVHGFSAEDVKKDLEGLQTMRNLARNMSFMIKAFADKKSEYPIVEKASFTSFTDGK